MCPERISCLGATHFFLLPPSRVALWVGGSCSSCDSTLDITIFAELWSFRNCIVFSESQGFEKVKKFKMLKTFVLLFCLSVTLGEYFFWLAQFYVGVFLPYHGTIEVFAVLSMLKKAPFNG